MHYTQKHLLHWGQLAEVGLCPYCQYPFTAKKAGAGSSLPTGNGLCMCWFPNCASELLWNCSCWQRPGLQDLKHSTSNYWVSVPGTVSWHCLISFSGCRLDTKTCTADMRGEVLIVGRCVKAMLFSNPPFSAGSLSAQHCAFPPPQAISTSWKAVLCLLVPVLWVTGQGQGLKTQTSEMGESGPSSKEHWVGSSSEGFLLSA